MNQNEFCDILLVMMGVFMIFFISTRKPKELFKICDQKILKKKKKIKKSLEKSINKMKEFICNKMLILEYKFNKQNIPKNEIIIENFENDKKEYDYIPIYITLIMIFLLFYLLF